MAAVTGAATGLVHSWDLSTGVDGPGTRLVVFLTGCPLRCLYCHNPDTWCKQDGTETELEELAGLMRRDLAAFGARVSEMLVDPHAAERIGEAAQARVRDQFLGPRHLGQYVDLLGRVLAPATTA